MHAKCVYKWEKIKISTSSGMHDTIYHNITYLLLFGKRKLQSLEISWE